LTQDKGNSFSEIPTKDLKKKKKKKKTIASFNNHFFFSINLSLDIK